jgi:hypothetical protein
MFPLFPSDYCETPIPKAKRIGIGKLNNPAKRRVQYAAACFVVHTRDLRVFVFVFALGFAFTFDFGELFFSSTAA